MKVLFRKGRKYYWFEGDFHSNFGSIKEKNLKDGSVKSNIGREFFVMESSFIDKLEKIKRGPAIMAKKDIGMIIAETGIGKESVCVDAGTGCGFLAAYLGKVCKKVYSYEKNKEYYELSKKNLNFLNIKNVKLINKDIRDVKEENIDLVVLDLSNPWDYLKNCYKALKNGGFLVAYLPNVNQVSKLTTSFKKEFVLTKVCEVLERCWVFDEKRSRPENQMLGHTCFLVFLRKV